MNWYKLAQNSDAPDVNDKETPEIVNWKNKEEMWDDIQSFHPKSRADDQFARNYNDMKVFRESFSYAVPSHEAMKELVQWIGGSKVIEIGAGRGLWARLLSEEGVNVEASDLYEIPKNKFFSPHGANSNSKDNARRHHVFFNLQQMRGDEHARQSSTNDILMMVWPYFTENDDEGEDWQSMALKNFNGSKFIFVGETEGGATGSPALWRELNKSWRYEGGIDIPRWQGINDHIQLYVRK